MILYIDIHRIRKFLHSKAGLEFLRKIFSSLYTDVDRRRVVHGPRIVHGLLYT